MGTCRNFIRGFLFVQNLIFWFIGVALIAFGSYILVAPNIPAFLKILEGTEVICYVAIGLGVVLFVIGFFGCCGAFKKNKCLLKTYSSLLMLLVLLEIGTAIFIWQKENEFIGFLAHGWYSLDETSKTVVQKQFECCGFTEPEADLCLDASTGSTYEVGCYVKLRETIIDNFVISVSVVGAIALLQICSIIASCLLGKKGKPVEVRPLPHGRNAWATQRV